MGAYQYIVFLPGKQPTVDDVREFQKYAGALAGQFAWGTTRHDFRLTLAVERQSFDHVQKIDPGFTKLVARWQQHGCELVDHLAFVKNGAALRPVPSHAWHAHDGRESIETRRAADQLVAKEHAAREAVGRSMLAVQRTLDQFAFVQRLGAAVPYALIALGAITVICTGFYVRDRLLNSGRESRQATIERALVEQQTRSN